MFAAACSGGPDDTAPERVRMPEVGLDAPPGFDVGDTFRFDNPEVTWSVVAVEDGKAQWESDGGDAQVTDMNPLLPALEWSSETQGSGKRLISNVKGDLFPLEVGAKTTFKSTVSMDRPPYAWEADWSCEIVGVKQTEVPAGSFATFEVVCARAGVDENRFFYAPDLGHWVISATRERTDGPLRSRQLVAFSKARASTLVIGTDPAGETVISAQPAPKVPPMPVPDAAAETAAVAMPPAAVDTKPETAAEKPKAMAKTARQTDKAAPAAAQPGGTARYGLHIASYKNQSNVDPGWRTLKKRYGGVLGSYEPVVKRVDLGKKGVFYRLMAGPVGDRATARARCQALSKRGQYCKVIAL